MDEFDDQMMDPRKRDLATRDVLNRFPDGWRVGPRLVLILGRLSLAMSLVAACGAIAPVGNDPVPMPADLAWIISPGAVAPLSPGDASVPQISATRAVEIAGKSLLADLETYGDPREDPSVPDGLVRRLVNSRPAPPRSAWIVAYRWKAGGGSFKSGSFYYVDDRTGELFSSTTW